MNPSDDLTAQLYGRLLDRYGPLLAIPDIAREMRVSRASVYLRRSRGNTAGMPDPITTTAPLLYRAADIAVWLAGQATPAPLPSAAPVAAYPSRRRPGRPRKVADGV